MKRVKQVINRSKNSFLASIFILSYPYLHTVDAKDLEGDLDFPLTDIDDPSEGKFLNYTSIPITVFLLGGLATALLITLPLIMVFMMHLGGGEEESSGYGRSSYVEYKGDNSYYYSNRKRRSPGADININSK